MCNYSVHLVHRVLVVAAVSALWTRAHADGYALTSPRSIGRAGAATVGDDGGGALLVNPAAIARRDTVRLQLGAASVEDSVEFLPDTTAPRARNQAGSSAVPLLAIEAGVGDWVFGIGATTAGVAERALASPDIPHSDQLGNTYEYRYTGFRGLLRRDTVTAGVARRLGDAVALGFAAGISRVTVTEARRIWAGFRDTVANVPEPSHDVDIAFAAHDNFVPSAIAGVLVAPSDTRVELAASIAYSAAAHVEGDVVALGPSMTTALNAPDRGAQLVVHEPLALRTGARWAGEHFIGELDGELWLAPDAADAATWDVRGISVITSRTPADVTHVESRLSTHTHGAVRAACDVQLIAGYLWATAGYAFSTDATARSRMSPTFGQLGGHTAALGLETTVGDYTITFGWSHTWSIAREVASTSWGLDNPYGAGDAPVRVGRYDASIDLVGLSIDVELTDGAAR